MTPNDPDIPHQIRVPCYNVKDGCRNKVSYMGVGPVRKLCHVCQESGSPLFRPQAGRNLGKAVRKAVAVGNAWANAGFSPGEICYNVTVWPKTLTDGRVMPCRVE